MDVLKDILFAVGFIVVVFLALFLICMCVVAAMYESIFGKRFEIYDSSLLPDLKDYPNLESEPVSFPSRRGYKYAGSFYHDKRVKKFKGLLVFSHGIFNGQLSYIPEIAYFAERGYKVFAFDNTGCHLSGGKSMRGLPQSAEDLSVALDFLSKENELPVVLFGHSWGGYAVSAVSCYKLYNLRGVFVQSGFNRSCDMVLEEGARMFGSWIYMLAPYIKLYERFKYGKRAKYTARAGVARASKNGTRFLILHSTDDETISLKHSVLTNVDKNENVTLITEKCKGHNSLDSDRAIEHKKKLDSEFAASFAKGCTSAQKREFYGTEADKAVYFERDTKLMKIAADFYDVCCAEK